MDPLAPVVAMVRFWSELGNRVLSIGSCANRVKPAMAKRSAQQLRRTAAQMHALAAVRDDIGSQDTGHGRGYLREFTQHFREYDCVLSPDDLQQRVAAASTILIGDYHALAA